METSAIVCDPHIQLALIRPETISLTGQYLLWNSNDTDETTCFKFSDIW